MTARRIAFQTLVMKRQTKDCASRFVRRAIESLTSLVAILHFVPLILINHGNSFHINITYGNYHASQSKDALRLLSAEKIFMITEEQNRRCLLLH